MFLDWARRSLQRRLLLSVLLSVGLSLIAFQLVVDRLVDGSIARSFAEGASEAQREELLREVDLVLLGGVVTVLGICALATVLAVRRGLEPLGRVASAAQEVSVEQPARGLPLAGLPAEIQPLGERFNQLLARLAAALSHERRFAASLAHELRTPLAEIRALGEAGLARQDVAGLHEFLRQTTAAALGMQGVIESLLAVARAERVAVQGASEPVALGAAVQALLGRLRITDPAGYARTVAHVPPELWIACDPRLLDAMLRNLLANALQHGESGGAVEIDWLEEAAALRVRNPAPQLAASDLPRLRERFGDEDQSEPLSAAAGAGLGLWVVGRLAAVLGLRLSLELDAARRLSVHLAGFRPL
ncbi:MAG: HAMP domain-containing histidine kinase [Gammaproteobacteria bacterium]|nr:HAMP domain-containing histidine kinase [Gammaproteobacteria bacterium]